MVREMPARCSFSGDDIVINEKQDRPRGRDPARGASCSCTLMMLTN
jgi:hypothetical protein